MTTRTVTTRKVMPGLLIGLLAVPTVLYINAWYKQQQHYGRLRQLQQRILAETPITLPPPADGDRARPSFAEHLAVIPNFLPASTFDQLKQEIVQVTQAERTYLPAHKQGGTIAYETLHTVAPSVVAFYNAPELHAYFSAIIGAAVQPTPLYDQSSCSLLFYTKPGDHINWHHDHNFYNGRHFTVLLPVVNQQNAAPEQLSSAQLLVKKGEEEVMIPGVPNTLIVFEGAKVLHKVTRLGPDETRIMLSMTFATRPDASVVKAIARRVKDTAFFGLRALWT